MKDKDLDFSDIPEVHTVPDTAEMGKFYRPIKEQITIRIDKDVLQWFRGREGRYQSNINKALRSYIRNQ